MTTIQAAIASYLEMLTSARSPRTVRTYAAGLKILAEALRTNNLDPEQTEISQLKPQAMAWLIKELRGKSEATTSLYLTAATTFFEYLVAEELATINVAKARQLIRNRTQKQGRRIPKFPREAIEALISYAESLAEQSVEAAGLKAKTDKGRLYARKLARLRNLRDRALILFLADTGLRITEACSLTLGDVDFLEGRLTVISKGGNEDPVRVSTRALAALEEYLKARAEAPSGPAGIKADTLPLFLRHDRGAGDWTLGLNSSMGWKMVRARALEAAGSDLSQQKAAKQIHPHSFRHYFVTVVLLATNNLEKASRMARHKSIQVTRRYAEIEPELDADYHRIFNE